MRPHLEDLRALQEKALNISRSPVLGSFGSEWEDLSNKIGDYITFLKGDDSDVEVKLASLIQEDSRDQKTWKNLFPFLFLKNNDDHPEDPENQDDLDDEEQSGDTDEEQQTFHAYNECPGGPLYHSGGYRRHNHFRDFSKDFTGGCEGMNFVSNELREAVLEVCPKKALEPIEMKQVLKKAGFASMYQHSIQIGSQLNLFPAARFTPYEREQLDGYFSATEEAWNSLSPLEKMDPTTGKIRKSILPLSYLTSKYLQFLGKWEYLFLTRMPKNMARLRFYDSVWKAICLRNEWDFRPTRQDFCV